MEERYYCPHCREDVTDDIGVYHMKRVWSRGTVYWDGGEFGIDELEDTDSDVLEESHYCDLCNADLVLDDLLVMRDDDLVPWRDQVLPPQAQDAATRPAVPQSNSTWEVQ